MSDVQGAQVVGGNSSMVSGSIVGAGAQLDAAEDVGAGTVRRGKSRGRRTKTLGDQRKKG